jgi:Uncharacterized protein conserved in bacteria (DUF2325)
MPDPVLLNQLSSGSLLSPLEPPVRKLELPREVFSVSQRLGERRREPEEDPAPTAPGRRKIWDFATYLHCSIIGTCLPTAELRRILLKLGRDDATTASEHDLHASAVVIAAQRHEGAKPLHKALDRRYRVSINQFDRAKSPEQVRAVWKDAVQRGDIPGAYWASLTHPATNNALLREIFAEVHMLSHLVGAANRADIRRLRQLEEANAELEAKVGRQQQQLRDAVVSRETTIRELKRALEEQILRDGDSAAKHSTHLDSTIWEDLVAALKRRLATAASRCERLEIELQELRSGLVAERNARAESDRQNQELRQEIEAVEASLSAIGDTSERRQRLANLTLLYVGGRQAQIAHLRILAERAGATLLHHDGGIEERKGLLQGHISRADAVLFPVDCISHTAMSLLKRLCRQSGKPFLPLRGAGLAPFCAALNNGSVLASPAVAERAD